MSSLILFDIILVDAGKTGYQVNRDRLTEIRKITGYVYPDFLLKDNSYPSETILGVLYRKGAQFKRKNANLFREGSTDERKIYFNQV